MKIELNIKTDVEVNDSGQQYQGRGLFGDILQEGMIFNTIYPVLQFSLVSSYECSNLQSRGQHSTFSSPSWGKLLVLSVTSPSSSVSLSSFSPSWACNSSGKVTQVRAQELQSKIKRSLRRFHNPGSSRGLLHDSKNCLQL